MIIRLNKYLASAGVASRRKCDELILAKRIKVNDALITELGIKIDTEIDRVKLDDHPVFLTEEFIYIILNKPGGYITTVRDQFRRKTVLDLVSIKERIWPVGRLDYNTTGILLLTNDGKLSNFLIHPRYKVLKIYHVLLNKPVKPEDLSHFEQGIVIDGKKTLPCRANEVSRTANRSLIEVGITEGRNRQIRIMFESLGYRVEQLQRIAFGPLKLAGLPAGEWRYLTKKEVELLKKIINNVNQKK
jgi:23S rRNA pseudouridine2605 synthase